MIGQPEEIKNIKKPAQKYRFTRNLKLGSRGTEVKFLQKFLNKHNYLLAVKGLGSLGQETFYFGYLTQAALIKFQEANSAVILDQQKLKKGTGNFYSATRNFINNLISLNKL